MTADSRILTCSYNRRRNRIHPHTDESTMQTSKPKQSSLKARVEPPTKLSVVSENASEWPSIHKESQSSSLHSEVSSAAQSEVFRRRVDLDVEDDMYLLKRANPVYDSDDEDYMASPAKRQRTGGPAVLHWGERLSDDGFSLGLSFPPSH